MMDEEVQNMTATEADVLKMPSKMMEAAELPMLTETREGALKTAEEAHNRLEMVSKELKLMESKSDSANQIIQGVLEMVASMMEE